MQGDEWENLSPLAHTIVFGICSVEDCIVGKTKYPSFLFTMFFFETSTLPSAIPLSICGLNERHLDVAQ